MRRTVLGRGPAVYAAIVALLAIYLVTTVGQSAADVVTAAPDTNTAIQLQHGHTHGMELLHGRSAAAINATPVPSALTCDGDGTSGKRVQLVYLRGDGQSDRYNQMVSSFRQQASQVDAYINAAAQHTGGERHVRYVHDSACNPVVDNQVVPQSAMDGGFLTAVRVLEQQRGYNRADRKYMIWYEGTDVCGVSWGVPGDDRPGADNGYNGGPNYGLTGTSCWTFNAQLHELLHGLGGVQRSAPHSTTNGHCWDDEDVLCYNDGGVPNPPGDMVKVCTTGDVDQVDCNNDDYFSVQPPSGSYLATRWNTANNQFLIVGSSTGATPSPSTSPSQPQPEPQPQPSGTAWAPNTTYGAGTTVTYGGRSYQCLQAHTSLPGWEPPNVLALWRAL